MKLIVTTLSILTLLMACGPKADADKKEKADSLSTTKDTIDTKPVLEEVILTAHGDKPSWSLSITKTLIKFKLEGKDTVTASDYTMADNSTPELAYYTGGKDFGITVEDKPSKDRVNNVMYSKKVSISFQGKKYNGVGGEVVKDEAVVTESKTPEKTTTTDTKNPQPQGRITVNGKWFLQTLNGRKVSDADFTKGLATIDLDPTANRVSGFGGCNSINGTLTIFEGKKIKMEKIISTKMFCEGVPENEYLTALRNATNFSVVDNKLQLKDNTGKVLAVFVRGIK